MTAVISECGKYRYLLKRQIGDSHRSVMWLMLNPSTADATLDDPTIRRCIGFSKRWGCGVMYVCNLYAFRSPSPADLWQTPDPVGPKNDYWIINTLADVVVCAWGVNAKPERVRHVNNLLGSPALCLGMTKDGSPRHPLYVRGDAELIPWRMAAREGKP